MTRARGWVAALVVGGWLAPAGAPAQTGDLSGVIFVRGARSDGAVVYLEASSARRTAPAREPVLMDQRGLEFQPMVVPLVVGGAVAFRNSDPLLHNIFSPNTFGEAFDLGTYPQGESRVRRFHRPGAHLILCHIHPEMEAYVFVVPSTYFAVADSRGRFEVSGIPPGTYAAHVWHRRAEPRVVTVTVVPGETVRLEIQLERRGRRSR